MAQKQKEYEGVLDSIFSFIFAGAKQKVKAVSPRNIPGISGDEMAYALGEIAMRPGIYANEEVLTPLNEFFDSVKIAESKVKLDKENVVKVSISAKNISDFFVDPERFVESAFQKSNEAKKQARKLNMIRGFGGIVDLGVGAILARSAGAPPASSVKSGWILGNEWMTRQARDAKALELAASGAAFETGNSRGLNFNYTNKLAQTFASVLDSSQDDLAGVSDRREVKRIVGRKLIRYGFTNQDEINALFVKYFAKEDRYRNTGVKIEDGEWNLGQMDKGIKKEQSRGIRFNAGPDEWRKSASPADKLRALQYEELEAKVNLLPNTDPNKRILQRDLRRLEVWQESNGPKMKWSRYLGEASLNIQHLNSLVLQGGGLTALISGDFYDISKNNLAPSLQKEVSIAAYDKNEKFNLMLPRDDMNSIYRRITGLYYLTPSSLTRTFFVNGEGFGYLGYRKQEKMQRIIKGSESLYNYVSNFQGNDFALLLGPNIPIQNNQRAVLEELAKGDKYVKLVEILQQNRSNILNDPNLAKVLEQLEKLHKQLANSVFLKYATKLKAFMEKYSPKALFNKSVSVSLTLFLGKKLGTKAMQFLTSGKIVLRRLAKKGAKIIIHAIAQALGFATTGGLANGLIIVLTEVIYFLGEKVLKTAIKLGAFVAWAGAVIFLSILISAFNWLGALTPYNNPVASQFDTAGNTPPIFCERCGVGGGGDGDSDSGSVIVEPPADSGPISPPPEMSNVSCPLQPSPLNCSQGPYMGVSHASTNAIDVKGPPPSYWYAPSDGVITKSIWTYENSRRSGQLCGGIVHFYSPEHDVTYVLIHVVPYVQNNVQVTKGTPIAKMALESDGNINFVPFVDNNGNKTGTCTDGAHFHLGINGTDVYADRYYREFLNCDLGNCR